MSGEQEIETLEQAALELQRRKREDPLSNVYEPHQYQQKIHQSRADITLVVGGNRTGKSWAAITEALLYCLGRSTYAETPDPPNTVWYVLPSLTVYRQAIRSELNKLVPWNRVARHSKRERYFKFDNGSELYIISADQRQERLVGASVDLAVIDEPCPKDIYQEISARVTDAEGRILLVLTPVGERTSRWMWIRDDLYIPWQAGEKPFIDVINMPLKDEDGNPTVPHFTKEMLEKMERRYPDPQVRAARLYGEFVERAGLVFSQLDSTIHLVDRFEVPERFHRYLICDPQYHRFAVLYFAVDDKGNRYIIDEYFSQDEPLALRAERIKRMVEPVDREVPMYVDYANPQDITELNYHFERTDAPIGAVELPNPKKVEDMILKTHSFLEPDPEREYPEETGLEGVYGAPRLMFFNDLQSTWTHEGQTIRESRLLWELRRLTWGKKNKYDKESAAGADCTDCLIYGCTVAASGQEPQQEEAWKEGLSQRDIELWNIIDEHDKRNEFEDRRWR